MNYRIWDKKSPVNSVDAERFMNVMGYNSEDEVYIITDDNDADWIVQTFKNSPYPGKAIEEKALNHLNNLFIEFQKSESQTDFNPDGSNKNA